MMHAPPHDPIPRDQRLQAARARLILERPFLGTLVLNMPALPGDPHWCQTTATNGETFYYNPEYIDSLSAEELQFVLAHEALHCGLGHFARRQHRIRHRWDLACDYAINPLLVADGLKPPPGILLLDAYAGMGAEDIYPMLADNDFSETLDQHLYDRPDEPQSGGTGQSVDPLDERPASGNDHTPENDGNGNGNSNSNSNEAGDSDRTSGHVTPAPVLGADRQTALARQWQQRLVNAAHHARRAGRLSALQQRFFDMHVTGGLSWRHLLARFLNARARNDYSYARPCTRRSGPAILPGLRSPGIELVVAVDVSGSVSDEHIGECLGEIDALKGQLQATTVLIACDADLVPPTPLVIDAWERLTWPGHIAGGGTTDFRPVFDYLDHQDRAPDVLVYFTDGLGTFPPTPPEWPVIWLIKGKADVPWGLRLQLDE